MNRYEVVYGMNGCSGFEVNKIVRQFNSKPEAVKWCKAAEKERQKQEADREFISLPVYFFAVRDKKTAIITDIWRNTEEK